VCRSWSVGNNHRHRHSSAAGRGRVSLPVFAVLLAFGSACAVLGVLLGALISPALIVMAIRLRFPASLFGMFFTSWSAVGIYAAYAVVQFYLGRGLLRLRETARKRAIGLFCFGAANSLVMALPGNHEKTMRQMRITMPGFFQGGAGIAVPSQVWLNWLMVAVVTAVPIVFLARSSTSNRPERAVISALSQKSEAAKNTKRRICSILGIQKSGIGF